MTPSVPLSFHGQTNKQQTSHQPTAKTSSPNITLYPFTSVRFLTTPLSATSFSLRSITTQGGGGKIQSMMVDKTLGTEGEMIFI
jgi:hypothetical protein